jgi:hypothetical protein
MLERQMANGEVGEVARGGAIESAGQCAARDPDRRTLNVNRNRTADKGQIARSARVVRWADEGRLVDGVSKGAVEQRGRAGCRR